MYENNTEPRTQIKNNIKDNYAQKSEKGSNSCVIDLSLDNENVLEEIELNEKSEMDNNKITLNKSFDDIQNFKKKLNIF